jgi:hypothetical protein
MTALNGRYPAIQGEEEWEAELEAEDELESEFETELETEAEDEYELEDEYEYELEGETEWEGEGEQEFEFEFEAEAEAELESEGELEDEFEAELEEEAEGFVNPVRRVYRDAELMAHLANRAALTESEAEAEAFIGALVPMAAKLIPRAARLIQGNAPALVTGATRIVRQLRRTPAGRRLVKAVPVVLQRTAQSLADQAAAGRPIDGATVVRTLGRITGRVLRGGNARSAVRAVDVFNRRYHRRRRWQRRYYGPYQPGLRQVRRRGPARRPAYGARPAARRVPPARRRSRGRR